MREDYRSGFVTLIGRPNVGKSTLMNYLVGQKIAITSKKPQTTRNRIQTVLTTEEGQIVFVDTPGIHKAKNKLGEYMVNVARQTLNEVDVILWLVEPTTFIGAGEQHIIERLKKVNTPVILVINKIDSVKKEEILKAIAAYKDQMEFAEIVPVSARNGENTGERFAQGDNYWKTRKYVEKDREHRPLRDREDAGVPGKSQALGQGEERLEGQRVSDEKFWIPGRRIKSPDRGTP